MHKPLVYASLHEPCCLTTCGERELSEDINTISTILARSKEEEKEQSSQCLSTLIYRFVGHTIIVGPHIRGKVPNMWWHMFSFKLTILWPRTGPKVWLKKSQDNLAGANEPLWLLGIEVIRDRNNQLMNCEALRPCTYGDEARDPLEVKRSIPPFVLTPFILTPFVLTAVDPESVPKQLQRHWHTGKAQTGWRSLLDFMSFRFFATASSAFATCWEIRPDAEKSKILEVNGSQ